MTETAQLDDVASAQLAGRRALVTGGSRGIGAGIVRRLAADGEPVAFTYREGKGPANDLEREILGSGGIALAIQADSANPEALRAAIADTVGRFGGLDVLVNNAGTSHHAPIEEFPMAEYDRLLAVNVRAVFVAIQAALSQMDVPARQAYVMGVVDPSERTAAAAYTNTARYVTRPVAPLIAGATLRGALGAPFFIAGTLKSVYDLGLYLLFRDVKLAAPPTPENG